MIDVNASIVDQQVRQLVTRMAPPLAGDEHKQHSTAFVLLCARTLLDLDLEEAVECLTDGGQDAGIDAMHVGPIIDGELRVTLFQGKYKQRLDAASAFPAGEIHQLVSTIGTLFDPDQAFHAHPALLARVEEIRSLIRDGYLPHVRVVLCNNGARWKIDGDTIIDGAGFPPDRVTWEHLGPDRLIELMQAQRTVDAELRLAGKIVVEEFNFRRVLVGKVPVTELASLFERHGDRLLEKNIRRYLGMTENRVNRDIAGTLRSPADRSNFYFYNNGVTLVCSKFRHSALQRENHVVRVEDLQVINGGQTCHTIEQVIRRHPDDDFSQAFVLLRLYELEDDQRDLVRDITYATNSQNPVDLRDLRANDLVQQRLEMGLRDLGVSYERKRGMQPGKGLRITPTTAAEAVLAVWRRKPHLARFDRSQLFGRLYDEVFREDLTPAQVIVAVEILREVERRRKSPPADAPRYLPYASHFLAMLAGEALLDRMGIELDALTHLVLDEARQHLRDFDALHARALLELRILLRLLGVDDVRWEGGGAVEPSLQKLSASFRRGDLLEALPGLRERALATVRRMKEERAASEAELLAIEQELQEIRSWREGLSNALNPDSQSIEEHKHFLEQTKENFASLMKRVESMHYPTYDEQLVTWVDQRFGEPPA